MKRRLRNTKQKELLKEEVGRFNAFFTAENLLKRASKKHSELGIATVYRFLNDMVNRKELHSYVCDKKTLYSRKAISHFICERTGKIIHFDINDLNFLKSIREKIPGTITSVQLEIKGICDDCS